MNSSDNSTDSSEGSPLNHMEGPNIETEKMLPSVVSWRTASYPAIYSFSPLQLIATEQKNIDFFLSLCDFAILRGFPQLRDSVRNLLKLLPTGLLSSSLKTSSDPLHLQVPGCWGRCWITVETAPRETVCLPSTPCEATLWLPHPAPVELSICWRSAGPLCGKV